jgi:hypothetical protein
MRGGGESNPVEGVGKQFNGSREGEGLGAPINYAIRGPKRSRNLTGYTFLPPYSNKPAGIN